jgi:uncharacterized membrane protein
MKKDKTISRIISLGIISGMRATFAPAIAAHYLSKQSNTPLAKSKLGFMQSATTAVVTKLLGAAEITTDKLPNTPNRIIAPQIIARVISGALAGAVISTADKANIANGIVIGGATALAATYGTYYLRKFIDDSTFIKEPVTGVLEDALALTIGVLAMK